MPHHHTKSLKKTALTAAVLTALGTAGMVQTASATVYDFTVTGYFTMLDPTGAFLANTSPPYATNQFSGKRTAITGTLHYDTLTNFGSGSATISSFNFFNGSSPAVAQGVTLQYIGNGTCTSNDPLQGCQSGNLLLGNMLFNWSGNNGIPVSIVWDASGMLNAISGGNLIVGSVITSTGALPASNTTKTTLQIGPAPVSTTTWNTTTINCAPGGGTTGPCLGVSPSGGLPLLATYPAGYWSGYAGESSPIGGSPMVAGPFGAYNANFDFLSMTVTCINNVCGSSQLVTSSETPANGTANVDPSTTVAFTFTQPMQALTVASAFTLSAGAVSIAGTLSPPTGNATSFTFTPTSALSYSTSYTATVTAAALDATNNPFTNAPVSWTFTTKPQPQISTCTVSSTVPVGSNFTMLDPAGSMVDGTNDVAYTWDGTTNTAVNGTNFNMTLASVSAHPFYGFPWSAHHIRVFGPGTYNFDTTCTIAQITAGVSACNNPLPAGQTKRYLTMTVGAGQLGAHMLFDWNGNYNINVVNVWNQNAQWSYPGTGTKNRLYNSVAWGGPAGYTVNPATTWKFVSTDNDGDGINGVGMVNGPFQGFNANFNLGAGDSCLVAAAPATQASEVGKVSGGCSISTMQVNPSDRADWWLSAGLLAWLGVVRRRVKRQHQA